MKYNIDIADIRALGPCYDPIKHIPADWSGTILDILNNNGPSFDDRIWVVSKFAGDKVNRLFAIYCARQAIALVENPDHRSIAAIDTAELFISGKCSEEELSAAWSAAWSAWSAARSAAESAESAAFSAASSAARSAAESAESAARSAAKSARSAAAEVARSAEASAYAISRKECEQDFIDYLILLIGDEL